MKPAQRPLDTPAAPEDRSVEDLSAGSGYGIPGETRKQIQIKQFDYLLPDEAIAKYPLADRDQSRLLVWKEGKIEDRMFSDLPFLLPEGSMLIFNNTRVIKARLHFFKSTGARIEVFCLEPTLPHDYVLSFASTNSCRWKCIVGNLKRWKEGVLTMRVELGSWENGKIGKWENEVKGKWENEVRREVLLKAVLLGELEGGVEVEFSWDNPEYAFSEILEAAGNIPIPPYLHRDSEEIDTTVYQTVYSKIKGSVAAPTAGLHFTPVVFEQLVKRNISCKELTLHVGAGTFQPVKSDSIGEHRMHTEHFMISKDLIDKIIFHIRGHRNDFDPSTHRSIDSPTDQPKDPSKGSGESGLSGGKAIISPVSGEYIQGGIQSPNCSDTEPGKIFAVGTTSVRTLESLYWIGCKILEDPEIGYAELGVKQWDPYYSKWADSGAHIDEKDPDCKSGSAKTAETAMSADCKSGSAVSQVGSDSANTHTQRVIGASEALQAISGYLERRNISRLETSTQIIILPGYRFRVIDGLVTNFHQPQSTLLLLISAVLGSDWERVYEHALKDGYRFLSYGDANLYFCPASRSQPEKI
ncbi:MAG: S-adenosylmethionine:tRNA ribosyltransferase-isomerase [Prolixibacteraceae bacterium]